MAVREIDPLVGFNFAVEVVGGQVAATGYFTEIAGVGSEHNVVEHKTVDESGKEIVHMIPGRIQWGELTLKRGVTTDVDFWKWRDIVVMGDTDGARSSMTITMFDRSYEPVVSWQVVNAWPSKITGPQMAADSNDFTVEELTIVHEGLKLGDAPEDTEGAPAGLAP